MSQELNGRLMISTWFQLEAYKKVSFSGRTQMKKKLNMITKTLLKAKKKNPNQNQKLNHKHTILMGLMMTRENLPKSK